MREHPVLAALGALAAVVTILTFVFDFGDLLRPPFPPVTDFCDEPQLSLSRGSGSSGTQVVISGAGFPNQRTVELRFHTEVLAPARTDGEGRFEGQVRIPGTFDPFAPQQFGIVARVGACHATVPFLLERPSPS
jgi:hypothetical protein